jgi:O-glycosyl hydrolase
VGISDYKQTMKAGLKMGRRTRWLAGLAVALLIAAGRVPGQYIVNGGEKHQIIDGFGACINHRSWNGDELKPVLNTMIGQGGFRIFRVIFDNTDWVTRTNADAIYYNSIYGSARFAKLWDTIAYLNQRGITNGIMLGFCGPGPDWLGGQMMAPGLEREWARMIASAVAYGRNARHLQFDLLGPDNEPNLASYCVGIWAKPSEYARMLDALAQELDSSGVGDVRLVAPEVAFGGTDYLPDLIADPRVMSKLAHFAVHNYQTNNFGYNGITNFLAHSKYPDRNFWMTEFNYWCGPCNGGVHGNYDWNFASGTAEDLVNELACGASAGVVWEGYDSYYELLPLVSLTNNYQAAGWSFYGLFGADDPDAGHKTYTVRKSFYTMSQISAFVPPGSQRIGVSGSQGRPFTLLAFYHAATGRLTLTGYNTGETKDVSVTLQSLPAVTAFDLYYTDANTNLSYGGAISSANNVFTAAVPGHCIFTLTGFDETSAARVMRLTNTTMRYGGWSGSAMTVAGPAAGIIVTPPAALMVPKGRLQFAASVVDAQEIPLSPQPRIGWLASGGGVMGEEGQFTAGDNLGGPFTVVATSAGLSGTALVNIVSNVNAAPDGIGYVWYNLPSRTANTPQYESPGVNDGDLVGKVSLLPCCEGAGDFPGDYEAAGVIWMAPQTINRVVYINGPVSGANGSFVADFGLQFTRDGATWTDAGPEWTVAPAYGYNSTTASGVSCVFSGSPATVLGVRCLGQVNTGTNTSTVACVTEVQTYLGAPIDAAPVPAAR